MTLQLTPQLGAELIKDLDIVLPDEGDRSSRSPGARSPAYPVNVGLDVFGHIEVDDMGHRRQVQSP